MSRALLLLVGLAGCVPALRHPARDPVTPLPAQFERASGSRSLAEQKWQELFSDPNLIALIDEALSNNQELAIIEQEIRISEAEVLERRGEPMPRLGLGAGVGAEKVGEFTSQGASDAFHDVEEGVEFPEPLGDFHLALEASWEVDVWGKLRNATKAARARYLASIEGRNFMVTVLVAELARSWYELLSLDNQLLVVQDNIALLEDSLQAVRLQKEAARVTELGVQRFEAELLRNQSHAFELRQEIVETENRINGLCGRYPQPIERQATSFADLKPAAVTAGLPTSLLENRPDVREAELRLQAARLDVKSARAAFYPSLGIDAEVGVEAYAAQRLTSPESLLYGVAADLFAPLLNRKAIKARYLMADSKQMQAVISYEQTVLNAYLEASNGLARVDNLGNGLALKERQVERLQQAIETSNNLFRSARADYLEVLTTRREALESQVELYETKQRQMSAVVDVYQALGGGWREPGASTNP